MKMKRLPCIEHLRECFEMRGSDLVWRARPVHHFHSERHMKIWNARQPGTIAGHVVRSGHLQVLLGNQMLMAHRIAWAIQNGRDPGDMQIDHVDGNPRNNAPDNLRLADHSQNMQNRQRRPSGSRTGVRGVTVSGNKYMVRVGLGGKSTFHGMFRTLEEARQVAEEARRKLFGSFAGRSEWA